MEKRSMSLPRYAHLCVFEKVAGNCWIWSAASLPCYRCCRISVVWESRLFSLTRTVQKVSNSYTDWLHSENQSGNSIQHNHPRPCFCPSLRTVAHLTSYKAMASGQSMGSGSLKNCIKEWFVSGFIGAVLGGVVTKILSG